MRSTEEIGESPLFPTLAIVGAAALYATLPTRFVVGASSGVFSLARWIVPALTLILLLALLAAACRRAALPDSSTCRPTAYGSAGGSSCSP